MMDAHHDRGRRIYRVLLRVFPRWYRERFGAEMEETFVLLLRRGRDEGGVRGAGKAWVAGAWDALSRGLSARLGGAPGVRPEDFRSVGSQRKRDLSGTMAGILGDVRYGVRALLRRPLFALTVVLTLGLGIGANSSVFTVVDGFLFTPLPYEEPEELVTIWAENPVLGWNRTDVSPANAWDYRQRARSLEDLAVYYNDAMNLTGDGPPELVSAVRVSFNVLDLLGRSPVRGRGFAESEMGEGRDRVIILSDAFWRRRFGGDPEVLESTVTLDGEVRTVIGIMGPEFRFLDQPFDVLLPQDLHPNLAPRDGHYGEVVARMAEGVGLEEVRAELQALAHQLQQEHPETNTDWTVEVVSTHSEMVGPAARQASVVFLVAVAFVLVMVCVNLGNLLLARGASRGREMAIRSALGAGRGRVVRQLLTESLVMAVLGGGLGLLLSFWGYRAIVAGLPSTIPPVFRFGLDGSVLAFTGGVTCLAALLFGVVPALRASRFEPETLRDGGRGGRSRGVTRFGSFLVVAQTAMAAVLLVGGTLLMKSIAGMRSQDLGFDPAGVLTLRLAPPASAYPGQAELDLFWEQVLEEVRGLPSVEAAGTTQSHPLMGSNWGRTIQVAGEDVDRTVRLTYASPGLFDALGVRVEVGRALREADGGGGPMVAVVNRTFVQRYLGEDVDPLDAALSQGAETLPPVPIVGVIQDLVERSVDDPPEPSLYLPASAGALRTRSLVLRTGGPPAEAAGAVQEAVWRVDPDVPVFQVETMEALIRRRIGGYAVLGYLMGFFAGLSLLLGAVGIYGVTAYAAGRRAQEIGLRLAVGAERGDVIRMVVTQGTRRALAGLVLGLGLSLLVTGGLGSVLVGVDPRDPSTFLGVALLLAAVSLLGLWIPARRAASVDPVRALSSD
jgi:putative ABC transport system permease protein